MTDSLRTLAGLLEYPAGQDYAPFSPALAALSQDEREELYTATFDMRPACVPYVGIHLFGEENFKRGVFMAALNARYAAAGFDARGELPDHVAVLLRFIAETGEAERRELIQCCLLGPLDTMIAALAVENPYRGLLETVRDVLATAYPGLQPAPGPRERVRPHSAGCGAATEAGCGGCGPVSALALSTTP